MKDLISRRDAINALDGELEVTGESNAIAVTDYLNMVRERLELLPFVDAVEVVRCRDCRYSDEDEIGRIYCRSLGGVIGDYGDGYCADGERKE